ncbi:hypothetical protein DL764_004315 [Monosporascus ibericus]|uniref:ribonuclease H n=1 Tax=Monosporascus ibericus TaxID=155417 RepID=A0A4Q4TH70_9PEZI|nr:hypothetical protein DL764_004315 [Monosporascus ibericus]
MGGGILLVPESESSKQVRRRLTRRATVRPASLFPPRHPDETPEHHFPLQTVFTRTEQPRFVNRYDSREILIVVDGSCLNNGRKNDVARGGCSFKFKGAGPDSAPFSFRAGQYDPNGTVGFRLERSGPGGEPYEPTSNRAKLRAVIAALEFREWHAEGWRRVVLATDLEYVVFGATQWLPRWVRRRWRTQRTHKKVANRDLWEELNGIVESLRARGTEVSFWLIPPASAVKQDSTLVRETKRAAREAAVQRSDPAAAEFTRLCGIMV